MSIPYPTYSYSSTAHPNDIHIHVHVHIDDSKIDQILRAVNTIQRQEHTVMSDVSGLGAEINALTAQVANEVTVEASAITLINGIAAQIAAAVAAAGAAGATPEQLAALTALGASVDASAGQLSAAVTANTPVPPPA